MAPWEPWLAAPERVCPYLAAPAFIQGSCLKMRLDGREYAITAPRGYLRRLYDWCNGEYSRAEIERLAAEHQLGPKFVRFVDALMEAGLLVDAAQYLPHAARRVKRSACGGLAAPQGVWTSLRTRLPSRLPIQSLPLPTARVGGLSRLLDQRQSARGFSGQAISLEQLSGLVAAAYGVVGSPTDGRRAVASAGGFYRLELTVALFKAVGQFVTGVYRVHYGADGQIGIERTKDLPADIIRAFAQPHRLSHATGVLVIGSDLRQGGLKYRNRIYPYALLEAGGAIQNAGLASAELAIGWRVLGGFDDDALVRALSLETQSPLVAGVFGAPCGTAMVPRGFEFRWGDKARQLPLHVACVEWSPSASEAVGRPCWGRDRDPIRAYDKAVSEAVERQAYRVRRSDIEAAASELRDRWLHPDSIVRYAASQYRRRGWPLARFEPEQRRRWARATRLSDQEAVWVPADFVFAPTAFEGADRSALVFHAISSGCASHRTLDLAVQSAVLELVERDAFVRHWLAQRPGVPVDPTGLSEEVCAQIAALRAEGCEVSFQVLQPSGVPVWMVLIRSERRHFTCLGAACALDSRSALESAFFEACAGAQVRLGGDAASPLAVRAVNTPRDHANLHAQRRHFRRSDALFDAGPTADLRSVLAGWPADFNSVLERLAAHGIGEPHVVDLTMPDAPTFWSGDAVHTVRALVPGLVPLTFGHGALPLGMVKKASPDGLFPHPFP